MVNNLDNVVQLNIKNPQNKYAKTIEVIKKVGDKEPVLKPQEIDQIFEAKSLDQKLHDRVRAGVFEKFSLNLA